jgi:ATP-dependent DNA helicase PIF1
LNKIKSKKYVYKRTYKNSKENLTQKQKMKAFLVTDFERENEFNYLKNNTLTEETLNLKVGAFVMCVSNLCLEQGVSNGSIGKVIDFENKYPVVQFEKCKLTIGLKEFKSENIPGISIYQVPLILAWSITIHKSQGLTLERAIIDVGNDIFEGGQMYVALSRIQSLKGLYLKEFDLNSLKINKKVLDFYSYLENTY